MMFPKDVERIVVKCQLHYTKVRGDVSAKWLTHLCLSPHKDDIDNQSRPRSGRIWRLISVYTVCIYDRNFYKTWFLKKKKYQTRLYIEMNVSIEL